jgi:N-acetyl-alpha-D-muramate 1-phosphate uridylyltransferase
MSLQAMIFAAGLGTRFKPFTDKHPKALVVVNGKTLLQRNIEYLQQYNITNVVVNVHHFADQIIEAVKQHHGWGSTVTISDESNEVLETGGGLLKAQQLLKGNELFLTLNADILTNLNIDKLIAYHRQQQALITLSVTNRSSSRQLLFNQNNRLCGWQNTNTGEQKIVVSTPHFLPKAYSCVAVFEPNIFELITQTGKFSLIDVYLSLAAGHPIEGFDHSGDKLVDVGRPESIAAAEQQFI